MGERAALAESREPRAESIVLHVQKMIKGFVGARRASPKKCICSSIQGAARCAPTRVVTVFLPSAFRLFCSRPYALSRAQPSSPTTPTPKKVRLIQP